MLLGLAVGVVTKEWKLHESDLFVKLRDRLSA